MSRKPTTPRALSRRGTPRVQVPGLSGSTNAAIARLERDAFSPGEVARAYYSWRRLVTGPRSTVDRFAKTGDTSDDNDYYCRENDGGRDRLAQVARLLPRPSARELRQAVAKLDAIFMARSRQIAPAVPLSDW